jgi:hypothetical protein
MIIKRKHVVHINLMMPVFTYKNVVALPERVLEDSLRAAGCHTPRKTNYYMCIQIKQKKKEPILAYPATALTTG